MLFGDHTIRQADEIMYGNPTVWMGSNSTFGAILFDSTNGKKKRSLCIPFLIIRVKTHQSLHFFMFRYFCTSVHFFSFTLASLTFETIQQTDFPLSGKDNKWKFVFGNRCEDSTNVVCVCWVLTCRTPNSIITTLLVLKQRAPVTKYSFEQVFFFF